ncbi:helix-turn-helix transcriptional regulator [Novosphingobium sp.]|uniref:helix-turn-helix transcriptional regulator n=1 Tax=Novosphingobium sp. TaxID=1874826 RepID=UPI003D0BD385
MSAEILDTIDMIYSAAVDPAGWGRVLKRLADMTGSVAGGLTLEDPVRGLGKPITFFGFDPDHVQRCFDHYLPMNPLFGIEAKMQPGFIVANEMVVATDAFRRSEFYDGWARPQGLCSPLSIVLHRSAGRYIPLTLVRPDGADEVNSEQLGLLETLSPHLIRAMEVSLKMERLDLYQDALQNCFDRLPVGIVLLDDANRVLRINSLAGRYVSSGIIDIRHAEIRIKDTAANVALQKSLAARIHDPSAVLPDISVHFDLAAPVVINVVPIVNGEPDFDDGRIATMLVIRSTSIANAQRVIEDFAVAHDLTGRELALLTALATDGASVAECASQLKIGLPTAKTHLQRIFAKTGTRRQGELLSKIFRSVHP